ncbi:MAG: hypothetical protein IIB67_14195 [Proteobacteria bacterium]|nr:hypothetical protein [Pseudomonadota bacterium]
MPSKREIFDALFGSWRLMRFDADGMNWFDFSIGGFWRSFFAVLPAAPFFALLVYLNFYLPSDPVDAPPEIFLSFLVYGFGWAMVPLIMMPVTKLFGVGRGFIPMMVAYNWTAVPQITVQALAALPGVLGLVSDELSATVRFAVVVYVVVFEWFVIRTALQITTITAIGIVMLLETVGILIHIIIYG